MPVITSVQPFVPLQHRVVDVAQATNAVVAKAASPSLHVGGLQVTTPTIDLPAVSLPLPLKLPPLPPLPIRQGLLGA